MIIRIMNSILFPSNDISLWKYLSKVYGRLWQYFFKAIIAICVLGALVYLIYWSMKQVINYEQASVLLCVSLCFHALDYHKMTIENVAVLLT